MQEICMPAQEHVTARLKAYRDRAGLSMEAIAHRLGYKGGSSYQRYEDSDRIKKDYLPFDLVLKLAEALEGLGSPPLTRREILTLSQYSDEDIDAYIADGQPAHAGNTPDLPPSVNQEPVEVSPESSAIEEVEARAAAGAGSLIAEPEGGPLWHFPSQWISVEFRAKPPELKIITIDGDSMVSEPPSRRDLEPGDKVIVNTSDTAPSPPGIFIIYDGLGLVAKRAEFIANSEPPLVRLSSNNREYQPYERTLEEAHIWGRVVGRWQRF